MNRIRKLSILAAIIILLSLATTVVFGWFYFPNAKGLELDTAPALDINVKLYQSNGTSFVLMQPTSYKKALAKDFADNNFKEGTDYYTISETKSLSYSNSSVYYFKGIDSYTRLGILEEETYDLYDSLYTLSVTQVTSSDTYSSNTVYYLASYSIEENYEFFQWGDEYICENQDSIKYYALECICLSDACTDGYIRPYLNINLDCHGAFNYGSSSICNASIPLFEASYKYATSSAIDLSSGTSLTEAKAESSTVVDTRTSAYKRFLNGKYYTLSNNEYILAQTYSSNTTYYTLDLSSEIYVKDQATWNSGTYSTQNLYYYDDTNSKYIPTTSFVSGETSYYKINNAEASTSVKDFKALDATNTFDGISAAPYNILNELTMDKFYNEGSAVNGLDSTQYVHANDLNYENDYIRFVIFIRIEPDEDFITAFMNQNKEHTEDASSTEIKIANSLTLNLSLRTVPKYSDYPEE